MGKCPDCGGSATLLFSSWACDNSSCKNYKPAKKQDEKRIINKTDILKEYCKKNKIELINKVSVPSATCRACKGKVILKPHADTQCGGCGAVIINEDVKCMTIARIKSIDGSPVQDPSCPPKVVYINESSLPCVRKLHGVMSQGGEFITGYDGSGSGSKVNLDIDGLWLRDYCAECDVDLEIVPGSEVVLLRAEPARWEQLQSNTPRGFTTWKFLFSSSYGGDGIKVLANWEPIGSTTP